MSLDPFWKPSQYIPIVGMLCGSTISGMVIAINFVLREIKDNRDKVEIYLAFGATRQEACRPLVEEALRLALLPTVNQMSVIGLISIPGMMTGALLGGSSVEQAAKLQMVIMFMISACTALAAITASVLTLMVVVDKDYRIRIDRITEDKFILWRVRDSGIHLVNEGFHKGWFTVVQWFSRPWVANRLQSDGENQPLLQE